MATALVINSPSNGARALASEMGILRVRPERMRVLRRYSTYINWGCDLSDVPVRRGVTVLNRDTSAARSKIQAFSINPEYSPPWSITPKRFSPITLARRDGLSSGRGIQVVRDADPLPEDGVDFYCKYIKKEAEYRIHVVLGKVIFSQQKRRRSNTDQDADQRLIRSHANGWVFCENTISWKSDDVKQAALDGAVESVYNLGLDFAAVDLIVERGTDNVYVLEANSRPGLESTALTRAYAAAFTGTA